MIFPTDFTREVTPVKANPLTTTGSKTIKCTYVTDKKYLLKNLWKIMMKICSYFTNSSTQNLKLYKNC